MTEDVTQAVKASELCTMHFVVLKSYILKV